MAFHGAPGALHSPRDQRAVPAAASTFRTNLQVDMETASTLIGRTIIRGILGAIFGRR